MLRLPAIILATFVAIRANNASAQQGMPPDADKGPAEVSVSGLFPDGGAPPQPDPTGKLFEGNKQAIAIGKQLFGEMNCTGCHFNGGGGMGPALMSGNWRYGGRIDQIYESIAQGRPNGMPSWQGALDPTSIWDLAAFVKSLSAQDPSSRTAMSTTTAKP
jgi:cytochrome c oxidase cbb3-type subunit 3